MGLNHICIAGRLAKPPERRYTQSQVAVTSFTIAVDRDFKDGNGEHSVDFVNCVSWRGTADFIAKYFGKGDMIIVSGRLQSRKWKDKDGNNRIAWEVNVDNAYFGGSKRQDGNLGEEGYTPAQGAVDAGPGAFSELEDADGELPF